MDRSGKQPSRLVDNTQPEDDAIELQDFTASSLGQCNRTAAFPEYRVAEPAIEAQIRQRLRRCPNCHGPNIRKEKAHTVRCGYCHGAFVWADAEKVTKKQPPSQSPDAAPMSSMRTEQDIALGSADDEDHSANRSLARSTRGKSTARGQPLEKSPHRAHAQKLVKGQNRLKHPAVHRLASEEQQRHRNHRTHTTATRQAPAQSLTPQPCASGPTSRHYNPKIKSPLSTSISANEINTNETSTNETNTNAPSRCPDGRSQTTKNITQKKHPSSRSKPTPRTPVLHQPRRQPPMTAELSATKAVMASNSKAYKTSDAAKTPLRERQYEIENFTTWERMKWRCQMHPCWETSEGCFFKSRVRVQVPGDGTDGTGRGHGDGCCERLGTRECCCNYGCQYCDDDGCCEGCGCVRCCGWEHGGWDKLDAWFGEEGCVVGCVGKMRKWKWKFW